MNVTIYGPNLPRSLSDLGTLVAHATGCPDTAKGVYRRLTEEPWSIEAHAVEDIIGAVYGDFEEYPDDPQADPSSYGQYRHDIHVFPCVALPEHQDKRSR